MPKTKRSLYQCFNAKVKGGDISCAKGHEVFKGEHGGRTNYSRIPVLRLKRGAPLELGICLNCPDYDEMGPPVPREERGW